MADLHAWIKEQIRERASGTVLRDDTQVLWFRHSTDEHNHVGMFQLTAAIRGVSGEQVR